MQVDDYFESEISRLNYGVLTVAPGSPLFRFIQLRTKTSWEKLEQTVLKNELPASTPSAFNDPFDVSPSYLSDVTPELLIELNYSLNARLAGKPKPLYAIADIEQLAQSAKTELEKLRNSTRVICFSERFDSPLLWAHYSDGYRGACLFFLGSASPMSVLRNPKRVIYSKQRPIYPLSLALRYNTKRPQSSSRRDALRMRHDRILYLTKASDWEYEQEARVVVDDIRTTSLSFEASELYAIVFGPKSSDKDISRVRNIVEQRQNSIRLFKAEISRSSFSMEVDWSTPLL